MNRASERNETRLTWLDATIGWLSPRRALARAFARSQLSSYRTFEAASKGRRTAGWKTSESSVNAETLASLPILRSRSRHLVQNNAYAARGVSGIVGNTIGPGIIPQALHPTMPKMASKADELWKKWGDTTLCDFDGQHDFYGLQALVLKTVVQAGECLVRRTRRNSKTPLPIPMQLQVLEPDFIDSSKEMKGKSGTVIVQGIEFNAQGERVAYWLFPEHPGEASSTRLESVRVPAVDILHIYRVDRPGQVRGIPWFAPVILNLRDLDEFEDAELTRRKIASCFAGFIHDVEGADLASKATQPLIDKIEPGTIEILPPGKNITFASPQPVIGYAEYTSQILHKIAVGLGVTYEVLTSDLKETNYSSARMGYLEMHRNVVSWRTQILLPRLCNPVWGWFIEAALVAGVNVAGCEAAWTAPKRDMIDPVKDISAEKDAVRAGFKSRSEVVRSFGFDPEKVTAEVHADNRKADELGLVFDTDARKTTMNGQSQIEKNGDAK